MSSWDDFPEWFRRRGFISPFRNWPFGDIDSMIREMEEIFEKEFKEFQKKVPKDLKHERSLPDGSKVREWGPFVYGYSIKFDPDGKPKITEFGNVKPSVKGGPLGSRKPTLNFKEVWEPIVDVFQNNGEIKVIVELPGVAKSDIKLDATEEILTISVDSSSKKYHKEIELQERIKPEEAKSTYKNGILEVILPKEKGRRSKGHSLKID